MGRSKAKRGDDSAPIKVTMVGDPGVGKTALLYVLSFKQFPLGYIVPFLFDETDQITVDGQEYCVSLWDTQGQEDYNQLRPLAYPGTDCFLVCYSVASRDSYDNVSSKWVPEIRQHCPRVPILLVATKTDLREEEGTSISEEEGAVLLQKIQAAKYIECSAKKMEGIKEVFDEAIRTVLNSSIRPKRKCEIL